MVNSEEIIPTNTKNKMPLLYNVTAIFVLVYSSLGTLFYATVLLYQIFDRNFLLDWEYNEFNSVTIIVYIMLQASLHGGLVFCAIQLLRQKKTGLYIFALSYLVYTLISLYMQYEYGWINTVVGLLVLIILMIYRKRLL